MIKEVKMYSVICDRCGKIFIDEFNCIAAWLDEGTAKEQAMESEWVEIGNKHYCPDCYEFDDELDEYVPKKKEEAMKELKVGERIILEVIEVECISCQDCFFAKEGYACPDYCYTR